MKCFCEQIDTLLKEYDRGSIDGPILVANLKALREPQSTELERLAREVVGRMFENRGEYSELKDAVAALGAYLDKQRP